MAPQTITKAPPLHKTRIDLSEKVREQLIERLNQTLASVLDLKTHTKQAHWNVKGKDFYQLHELFDTLATEAEAYVDLVAERITTLGGTALGTARLSAAASVLTEYPHDIFQGADHIKALADRYAALAKHVRESSEFADEQGDASTADLYTEVSRGLDMRLWFLEAHIQS
jgi:starvation-inducible DNA-binding protein